MTATQPTDRDQLAAVLYPGVTMSQTRAAEIADALLPVVAAIARHRAATELRAAADDPEALGGRFLRDRADALEAPQ